jgi:hypothetical protein
VSDSLTSRKQKEAETNAKIVDLFKDALDEIKHCRNEQQRVEFHIALACVMPARETQGTNNGWIARICDRLALKRGKRSQKNGGRPYASDQAVDIRARFNRQGTHDDRKNNVAHSSGSALASHVLQKGVAHGARKYTD